MKPKPLPISALTLRDWFAGQALEALLTGQALEALLKTAQGEICGRTWQQVAADESYVQADAMMEAREPK